MAKRINVNFDQDVEKTFLFDNEIAKNIYYVSYSKNVNINIKNFDIDIVLPQNENSVGIRLSKIKNISIVTICFPSKAKLQYMVTDKSNKSDVIKYVLAQDFHEILTKAIDLACINTLSDLHDIKL